jgi:multidrug efflux pump
MLVTGMIIGTVFTLFVVPSIYMLVARTRATVAAEEQEIEADAVRPPSGLRPSAVME